VALRGSKPEIVKPSKPKFMISGASGMLKTTFSLSFPKPFYIDTEGGATREQYMEKLIASEGWYMGKEHGSQDFRAVIEQIKELSTTKHPYKTLVIDSFSKLWNMKRAEAEETVGSEYARDKKEAIKPTRQLVRWLEKVDMNVVMVCHAVPKWSRNGKEIVQDGTYYDGWEKLEFDLDLWLEFKNLGKQFYYVVRKTRINAFPLLSEFPTDYKKFCQLYGEDIIEADVKPVVLATAEQVAEIKRLLDVLKIDPEEVEKWLTKGNADSWEEMSADLTKRAIEYCRKKIESTKGVN
jgi:hypothetical protein